MQERWFETGLFWIHSNMKHLWISSTNYRISPYHHLFCPCMLGLRIAVDLLVRSLAAFPDKWPQCHKTITLWEKTLLTQWGAISGRGEEREEGGDHLWNEISFGLPQVGRYPNAYVHPCTMYKLFSVTILEARGIRKGKPGGSQMSWRWLGVPFDCHWDLWILLRGRIKEEEKGDYEVMQHC